MKIRTTGQYVTNKKEGVWFRFQTNGKQKSLTRYENGRLHGWCLAFDSFGKESGRQYYYMGELIEGERLKKRMNQIKSEGINPNE